MSLDERQSAWNSLHARIAEGELTIWGSDSFNVMHLSISNNLKLSLHIRIINHQDWIGTGRGVKAYNISIPHRDTILILVADLVAKSPHYWRLRQHHIPVQMVSAIRCRPPNLYGQRGTGTSDSDADAVHNSHLCEPVTRDDDLQAAVYFGELGG